MAERGYTHFNFPFSISSTTLIPKEVIPISISVVGSNGLQVVELLLRHNQSYPQSTVVALKPTALPLDWSVRQRRSKPMAVDSTMKPALRASPTTPLSWSGATSISGGCGGSAGTVDGSPEESSRPFDPKLSKPARSEVCKRGIFHISHISLIGIMRLGSSITPGMLLN
ncbi:Uncharacterized protein Adt_02714 [Abeliophyllum distichum]|uniref:Uncharacterized protein n=1 Tax=Abeliophyllum distichum TaxID=126358 RepID=A0ABD1VWM1_9LAMI